MKRNLGGLLGALLLVIVFAWVPTQAQEEESNDIRWTLLQVCSGDPLVVRADLVFMTAHGESLPDWAVKNEPPTLVVGGKVVAWEQTRVHQINLNGYPGDPRVIVHYRAYYPSRRGSFTSRARTYVPGLGLRHRRPCPGHSPLGERR